MTVTQSEVNEGRQKMTTDLAAAGDRARRRTAVQDGQYSHGMARSLRVHAWRLHLGDTLERVDADVQAALALDEFFVLFQPRVSLDTSEVVAVEALLRWRDESRGLLGPKAFLPSVRQTGAMIPLGRHVLLEACGIAALWERERPADATPLLMSVNVTSVEVMAPTFTGTLRDILEETGLPLELLQLELESGDQMTGDADLATKLQVLRTFGLRLAIDVANSALTLGPEVRGVDSVQVGRRWVRSVGTDPELTRALSSLIDKAHRSGARVCAMGVEEQHQVDALRAIGCDDAQGYFFCDPVAADDLTWLDDE